MNDFEITIRMTTPMLANSLRPEDGDSAMDQFFRNRDGRVTLRPQQVYSMLVAAQNLAPRDMPQVSAISLVGCDFGLELKTSIPSSRYEREYYCGDEPRIRVHESFDAGTEISFRISLMARCHADELQDLLEIAGRYVGLSPYGHKNGYGRFDVVSVKASADGDVFIPGEK